MFRLIGKISLLLSIIGIVVWVVYVYPYLKWPDLDKKKLEEFDKQCRDMAAEMCRIYARFRT